MKISDLLIPELKNETRLTEVFLERVPADKLDYAPHENSMPLGQLCAHIVELYGWIIATMDMDVMDMANYQAAEPAAPDELVAKLKDIAPKAETSLAKDNEVYMQNWKMVQGDQTLMDMQRYTVIRSMVMNQFPHHRAQLGVYLRMLGVNVPATYGPSGDES